MKVIIVGASLSGLMTGIALARTGMNVIILERSSEGRRSGATLRVDSGETDYSPIAKHLRKLASGGVQSAEAWGSIEHRLRKEAKTYSNICLHFGIRIHKVDQNETSVWAISEKGETFTGDLLIGADGYRSIVRQQVSPHKANAKFAGYMLWIGMVDEKFIPKSYRLGPHAPLAMPDGIGDFLLGATVPGKNASQAVGDRQLGWAWYDNTQNDMLASVGCVKDDIVQHSLYPSLIPEETLIELNKKAVERWRQPWLSAIQYSIDTRTVMGIPIAEYVPDRLVNGRIALVGDAAHVVSPITASGFNSSLEDAASIAECLTDDSSGNLEKALLKYQSHRINTVRQMVKYGLNFSRSFGRQTNVVI